jgi:hypothetical protein
MIQNEASTPFLNLRFFLADLGFKQHPIYLVNDILFMLTFLVSRVILNILVFKNVDENFMVWDFESRNVPKSIAYVLPILGHVHLFLQLYWFALILRILYRKIVPCHSSRLKANSASPEPIPIQNEKSAKILGLPPNAVSGKVSKKLGLPEVANQKASQVLGVNSHIKPRRSKRLNPDGNASDKSEKDSSSDDLIMA